MGKFTELAVVLEYWSVPFSGTPYKTIQLFSKKKKRKDNSVLMANQSVGPGKEELGK